MGVGPSSNSKSNASVISVLTTNSSDLKNLVQAFNPIIENFKTSQDSDMNGFLESITSLQKVQSIKNNTEFSDKLAKFQKLVNEMCPSEGKCTMSMDNLDELKQLESKRIQEGFENKLPSTLTEDEKKSQLTMFKSVFDSLGRFRAEKDIYQRMYLQLSIFTIVYIVYIGECINAITAKVQKYAKDAKYNVNIMTIENQKIMDSLIGLVKFDEFNAEEAKKYNDMFSSVQEAASKNQTAIITKIDDILATTNATQDLAKIGVEQATEAISLTLGDVSDSVSDEELAKKLAIVEQTYKMLQDKVARRKESAKNAANANAGQKAQNAAFEAMANKYGASGSPGTPGSLGASGGKRKASAKRPAKKQSGGFVRDGSRVPAEFFTK